MKRIGLLSDTHGAVHGGVFDFFENVDEIWHAGDIGNEETVLKLSEFRPFRAVYGNIDGQELRSLYPLHQRFFCEEAEVWMTHIGGYPGHYDRSVRKEILSHPPKLFICGHSHILKVMYDKELELLHLNPGAAGTFGFQTFRTAIRFLVDGPDIRDLEIWQVKK